MHSSCKGEEELSRLRFLFPLLFQTFLYSSVPAPVAIHRPMPGSFVILAFPGRRRIVAQQPVHDRAGPVARAGKGSYMHWRVKRLCLPTSLYSGELCRKQVPGVNRRVGCFPRAQMHTANAKTLKCMTAKHHVVPLHRDAMVPRTGDREACRREHNSRRNLNVFPCYAFLLMQALKAVSPGPSRTCAFGMLSLTTNLERQTVI